MEKNDFNLIAFCGLYCANCLKYKKGKCPGCKENVKATWCKIRTCGMEQEINNCAECKEEGVSECKKFSNPIGNLFGFIFNSDRSANIQLIKDEGNEGFIKYMEENNSMTLPRRNKRK